MSNRIVNRIVIVLALILMGGGCLDAVLRILIAAPSPTAPSVAAPQWEPLFLAGAYGAMRSNLRDVKIEDFTVSTNSYGMRNPEISSHKKPGTIRAAIIGDSIAFGWGIREEKAFPRLLEQGLNQDGGDAFEVLNFAAPGFTSFHALKQFEKLANNFQPDILILAVGLYDSQETRMAESEIFSLLQQHNLVNGLSGFSRMADRFSGFWHWRQNRMRAEGIKELAQKIQANERKDFWFRRTAPKEYYAHLAAIMKYQQSQGGRSILVHSNLLNFETFPELQRLSEDFDAPLLNARGLFDQLGGEEERRKAFELNLEPAGFYGRNPGESYRALFRVYVPPTVNVPQSMYIVGNHPSLGAGVPNAAALNDAGRQGDERADDRVWSLEIALDEKQPFYFAFTNSGVKGRWSPQPEKWENTLKNNMLFFRLDPNGADGPVHWYSLTYIYGKIPFAYLMQANGEFPNELGHKIIANRLARLTLQEAKELKKRQN
ncbi:MAG: GDSL-type esterase/lipase family protein [Candidatus Omnitrophota bacterium]